MNEVQARYAAILADEPAELHPIFEQEAHYLQNRIGGRYSDALTSAVRYGFTGLTSPTAIARRDALTTFPPSPLCYGCGGLGDPGVCVCTLHEVGECEPTMCSPECQRRAELRGER